MITSPSRLLVQLPERHYLYPILFSRDYIQLIIITPMPPIIQNCHRTIMIIKVMVYLNAKSWPCTKIMKDFINIIDIAKVLEQFE